MVDKEDTGLVRWVVILLAIILALLALNARDEDTGPEWSGASHVDGRG